VRGLSSLARRVLAWVLDVLCVVNNVEKEKAAPEGAARTVVCRTSGDGGCYKKKDLTGRNLRSAPYLCPWQDPSQSPTRKLGPACGGGSGLITDRSR
jgi:hypothetical protein